MCKKCHLLLITVIFLVFTLSAHAEESTQQLRSKGDIGLDWQIWGLGAPAGFTGILGTYNLQPDQQIEIGAGLGIIHPINYALNYRYILSPQSDWSSLLYSGISYSKGFLSSDSYDMDTEFYWINAGWGLNRMYRGGFHFEIGVGLSVGSEAEGWREGSVIVLPSLSIVRIGWRF